MTTFNWEMKGPSREHVRTFLTAHGITRSFMKRIKFHGGIVRKNGREVRVTDMVEAGDHVQLTLPPEPDNPNVAVSHIPLEVLYEDDHFLVVNKPAGVASVPSHLYPNDSLANRVKGHLLKEGADSHVTHIVTRLDRETSGAVVFAKHHYAHSILDWQLKNHELSKRYVAVAAGLFPERQLMINQPIGRQPGSFIKRMVRPDGREAQTQVQRLAASQTASLLAIQLHTGRTHQIRVHLANLGFPLIGDWLYGTQTDPYIHRQALHCARVSFYSPFDQKKITCYAPLPADLASLINHEVYPSRVR
ncbi:RluA family pseudouridine synthase [Levilactobacillus bambusae]|uniref:Pseudouridine synthase n=1 Tax=Levilactobacillus bambusae TaxID=2024736 RepID=A0A2V1N077_9LACO|nr:RluA family pseudouridine synthase [Levilactobacillus bambusae]PWG00624.1 RluA family pseudouridine synthase [Levilactobacillus bambusae]